VVASCRRDVPFIKGTSSSLCVYGWVFKVTTVLFAYF